MFDSPTNDDSPGRHVVVLGHPDPCSFNHEMVARYYKTVKERGQDVCVRDLYELDFDPRLRAEYSSDQADSMDLDVAREVSLLRKADVLVLVYPIWIGMPPAIIKGYVDRVMGVALTTRDIRDHRTDTALSGKLLATFSSSATTSIWLDEKGQINASRQAFDRYIMGIFGMGDAGHTHLGGIVEGLSARFVGQSLYEVEEQARKICGKVLSARHSSKAHEKVAVEAVG